MASLTDKDAKAERIELRVTPKAKALLAAAAQARHTTVSEFLLAHGIEAAEQAAAVPRAFHASEEGWNAIQQMLDAEDQQPGAATIAWLKQVPQRTTARGGDASAGRIQLGLRLNPQVAESLRVAAFQQRTTIQAILEKLVLDFLASPQP